MLDKLLKYLPLISLYVIILGGIKQSLYYMNFSIPIGYYISLSEFGTSISSDLLVVIPVSAIYIVISKGSEIIAEKTFPEEDEQAKRVVKLLKLRSIINVFFTILLLIGLFLLFLSNSFGYRLILAVLFLSVFIGYYVSYKLFDKSFRVMLANNIISLTILYSMFVFTIIDTGKKIAFTEKGYYNGSKIKTIDSTYLSTDTCYFIGKTENYVFIYNKNQKATTIIPSDDVKQIYLKVK